MTVHVCHISEEEMEFERNLKEESFKMIVNELEKAKSRGHIIISPSLASLNGNFTINDIRAILDAMENGIWYDIANKRWTRD